MLTSRVISRPTTRKNSAIAASFTQCRRSMVSATSPTPIVAVVDQNASYPAAQGELAQPSASRVATRSSAEPPASVPKYRREDGERVGSETRGQVLGGVAGHVGMRSAHRTCWPYISPSGSAMSSMRAPSGSRK